MGTLVAMSMSVANRWLAEETFALSTAEGMARLALGRNIPLQASPFLLQFAWYRKYLIKLILWYSRLQSWLLNCIQLTDGSSNGIAGFGYAYPLWSPIAFPSDNSEISAYTADRAATKQRSFSWNWFCIKINVIWVDFIKIRRLKNDLNLGIVNILSSRHTL